MFSGEMDLNALKKKENIMRFHSFYNVGFFLDFPNLFGFHLMKKWKCFKAMY